MKSITLKDIPHPVHAALKQRAKRHGRSLNKEALACLEIYEYCSWFPLDIFFNVEIFPIPSP